METTQEVLSSAQEFMADAIEHLEKELIKIRAGKANPVMLDGIKVDYYGNLTPVNQVATVTAPDARTLAIQPWEKKMIPVIEKAIYEANLGLTPQNDGQMIRLPIPIPSEERRKGLVKQAREQGEQAKISIRNARREHNDILKKMQKDGTAEDMIKRAEEKVQELTDKYVEKVDEILNVKEEEIMTI